jgi:hypothetical protein
MIGVDGALYAIRRRLFVPPPDDTILDDLAIPMGVVRGGHRAVFEPEALAFEHGSRSAWEEFSRKARIVAGAVQFVVRRGAMLSVQHPQVAFGLLSHKVLRWLSPAFGMAAVAAAAALALRTPSPFTTGVFLFQIAFLAAGVTGCVSRARHWRAIGVAHYVCLVQAAAAVGLVRGLLRRQPATWQRFPRAPLEAA